MPLVKTTPPEPTRPTPPRLVTVPPPAALTPAPSPACRDSTYTRSWTSTPVGTLSTVPLPSASGTNPPTRWVHPESHTLSPTITAPNISTASMGHTRSCNRCARRPSRRMSTLPCRLSRSTDHARVRVRVTQYQPGKPPELQHSKFSKDRSRSRSGSIP